MREISAIIKVIVEEDDDEVSVKKIVERVVDEIYQRCDVDKVHIVATTTVKTAT